MLGYGRMNGYELVFCCVLMCLCMSSMFIHKLELSINPCILTQHNLAYLSRIVYRSKTIAVDQAIDLVTFVELEFRLIGLLVATLVNRSG
jgi:hypothetical protein